MLFAGEVVRAHSLELTKLNVPHMCDEILIRNRHFHVSDRVRSFLKPIPV